MGVWVLSANAGARAFYEAQGAVLHSERRSLCGGAEADSTGYVLAL